MSLSIRPAQPRERAAVANVLDGGLLVTPELEPRIDRGEVLVAVEERVLGAALFAATDGRETPGGRTVHVEAIAVRPRRRGQGIGRRLLDRLAREAERVTAAFPADVRPFYDACGFAVESSGGRPPAGADDRLWGVRTGGSSG